VSRGEVGPGPASRDGPHRPLPPEPTAPHPPPGAPRDTAQGVAPDPAPEPAPDAAQVLTPDAWQDPPPGPPSAAPLDAAGDLPADLLPPLLPDPWDGERDSDAKSRPEPGGTGEYFAVASETEHTGGLREGDLLIRRYRLLERIAEGGMSVIWRAFDEALQRPVAVKVHDGPFDAEHGCRELIRREARTAARLHHPDVIEVYDYGETVTAQGRIAAFVVMRLLEGRSLADRLREGPLPWQEAARIAERIALVLAAAHERGIVHRDVTPENVLLTEDGAKLLDFGIAAIADEQGNELLAEYGTPPYVAPERLQGVHADPAVDMYSLGVMLFEMLTGDLPYPERTWEAIEVVRRIGPPPVPDVPNLPAELALLCQSCLSPQPRQRPTAQHAAEVLARAAARRRGRHSRPTWATAACMSIALLAVGISLFSGGRSGEQRPTSDGGAARTVQEGPSPAWQSPRPRAGSVTAPDGHRPAPSPAGAKRTGPSPAEPTHGPRATPTATHEPQTWSGRAAPDVPRLSGVETLPEAMWRLDRMLDEGTAEAEIRADVARAIRHDVRQVVHTMAEDEEGLCRGIAGVRLKLLASQREGALSAGLRIDLAEQLDVIHAALTGYPLDGGSGRA